MNGTRIAYALAAILLVFGILFYSIKTNPPSEKLSDEEAPKTNISSSDQKSLQSQSHTPPPSYFSQYGSSTGSIQKDLEILNKTFNVYWRLLKTPDEIRLDSNASIVKTLTGDNRESFAFIDKESPFINDEGELLDRWGTPIAFHPISVTNIETRSAGPDRKFYTDDDSVKAMRGGQIR